MSCLEGLIKNEQSIDKHINNFCDFPEKTLLESGFFPIEEISELIIREGHRTNPLYSVHRWFARRLGSQFRSILTGITLEANDKNNFWNAYLGQIPLENAIVLDPFVGGGTSLVESIHCNARVIGYDIDPVATFISLFELNAKYYDKYEKEITDLCALLSPKISPYYKTRIDSIGECDVLHNFWVERRVCQDCGTKLELHPHYKLAYNKDLQWVFCKNCHDVYELPIQQKVIHCKCGYHTKINEGTLLKGKMHCPNCKSVSALSQKKRENIKKPEWFLFAQEYLDRTSPRIKRHFKKATDDDRELYNKASTLLKEVEESSGEFAPKRNIPISGRADQRPLIHGFEKYSDLFNDRQLLHLTLLGKEICNIKDRKLKTILSIAFSEHLTTNCMYTAYAFGYRRVSQLFSIHSFRHITRPVELNPWLKNIGRGTFPNCLRKIADAIEFSQSPTGLNPHGSRFNIPNYTISKRCYCKNNPFDVITNNGHAALVTHSSEEMYEIPNKTIDLVLSDPPYFNNISYSELSDFYLAWHQCLRITEAPYDDTNISSPISENLAVKKVSTESVATYTEKLTNVFCECYRVLKDKGLFVFTFHHKSTEAWCSVGEALAKSGFRCTAVIPLRGEGQGGLHSCSGTIKWDAVFVCRKNTNTIEKKSQNDLVLVPAESMEDAKRNAEYYYKRLKTNNKIGFREPDLLNLERALIVSKAFIGTSTDNDSILLYEALNM